MANTGTLTAVATVNGVTVSATPVPGITDWSLNWTSDSSGAVTQTTPVISGALIDVQFIPGAGGVQPSNNYAVTIKDAIGTDLLNGTGAALSNTTATRPSLPARTMTDGTTPSSIPWIPNSTLAFALTGGGNAKQGTIVLRVKN